MQCGQCGSIEREFGPKTAHRDLRRYRRRGPIRSTRFLIEDLDAQPGEHRSLLDIGGGIGAVHHALLDAGVATAVHVDISPDYIAAARDEATRRGHGERVRFVRGDFISIASELPRFDVVTLDRVICCYPDMEALVGCAADKARRVLGAVYPPDVWWIRFGVRTLNLLMRARRSDFRVYLHSPAAIEAVLRRHGLARATRRRARMWEVATFSRVEDAAGNS